ncbi:MAG: DNA-directed RNA polymerase subunit omega [Tractidigestivibacter sp.]|jgi:DNA-directed RNA polymerase subunit omega|uniref:DNA-directed RNA polymerase subunit omega n=1 Tax=Tractidigestivibacter sp. TaxID=2847320 RepID=UPI003D8A92DD
MSVIKPEIDSLLERTEHNPFLLCSVASKRACDINNMLRGQHLRVTAIQEVDDITTIASGKDTVSIAMNEIDDGTLGFVQEDFDRDIRGANNGIAQ